MSISPFHGGLVFREELIDSSYPTQIELVKSAVATAAKGVPKSDPKSQDGLNDRNLNEFFNPNVSKLSL